MLFTILFGRTSVQLGCDQLANLGEGTVLATRKKSLWSLLKIQILGLHPSREDGLQAHAGIVPSGDSGAAGLAPDCAATVQSHTQASVSLQIPFHTITEW